jgi:thiaminase (transcriptional activator TenA)
MAFSEALLTSAEPIREEIHHHPFVVGLGDGTLPPEKFGFYLEQDYLFLIEYCRVFGLTIAKAQDLGLMTRLAGLLHSTLAVEMELHRGYAAEFGKSREALEQAQPSAVTHAYTRHLLEVAWSGTLAEIVASLLPCQWGYWKLGLDLAARYGPAPGNPYRQWIATYASPEFGELAEWLRGILDSLTDGARGEDLARMERDFTASSRYELMFWDMAWRQEMWPVPGRTEGEGDGGTG